MTQRPKNTVLSPENIRWNFFCALEFGAPVLANPRISRPIRLFQITVKHRISRRALVLKMLSACSTPGKSLYLHPFTSISKFAPRKRMVIDWKR